MSNDAKRGPVGTVLHAIGRTIAVIVVFVWTILDEALFPLFRPLVRWLSGFRIFHAIGDLLGRLPPYVVLVCLAVPFVLIEPLKIVALYWIATGLVIRGGALMVFSYVLSIFTLDRIYHAGRGQLMQIGWFARLMSWLVGLRDAAFGWVKATAAWQAGRRLVLAARAWVIGLFRRA